MNNSREIREFVFEYMKPTLMARGYMNEGQLQKMSMLEFENLYNQAWDRYIKKMGIK